jgi:GT2 family glycosyltransferase
MIPGDRRPLDLAELEVSVVVPTRDRASLLCDTLSTLARQDVPHDRFEIIVVDDGSYSPVEAMVHRASSASDISTRVIRHASSRGTNAARNTGIEASRGELICLIDDDIDAPTGWLRALLEGARRNPEADCFGGPIRLRTEGASTGVCQSCDAGETALDLGSDEHETQKYVYSGNMLLRRRSLASAGALDDSLPIYFEEIEWQERLRDAGGVVRYLPDAWLWHRRTADDLRLNRRLKRQFRRGYGQARFTADRGLPFEFRQRWLGVPGLLAHSVRKRCLFGILATSGELGALWWALTNRGRVPSDARDDAASSKE